MHINPKRTLKLQEQTKQENVECKTEVEVAEQQDELTISTKNEMPDVAYELLDDQKDIKTDSNDSDFEIDNIRYVNYANWQPNCVKHFCLCSQSDSEIFKEKKPCKGKKRGPKLKSPQKCAYCDLEFNRTDRYVHHVRSKHTFEKPFKCDICNAK